VSRDGVEVHISGDELVLGDHVLLRKGDVVVLPIKIDAITEPLAIDEAMGSGSTASVGQVL
jgi:hypothetical protein